MCGIAAAINWPGARSVVGALICDLAHRGIITDPVQSPFDGYAMGTRRLPIVDAAGGVQPRLSRDGRILVAFNGEIYNHQVLRAELERLDVSFDSESDTEVLANALSLWGGAALHRLEGIYAFVALDMKTKTVLAARDPFGVKPLYLVESGDSYLFCSEIRPLLKAHETAEVMLLPPGHALVNGDLVEFRRPGSRSPDVAPADVSPRQLDRILRQAVQMRMPAGLPAACLFSGGIDSTLMVHYAREVAPGLPAYFLGDEEAEDHLYVARYADLTGLDLRMVSLDTETGDSIHQIDEIVGTVETFEPTVVRPALCTHRLAEQVHADGIRVALSGEGADELFAGYDYLEDAYALDSTVGAAVRDQALNLMHRTNLQRLDRCGMRWAVEIREPFLDSGLTDYALGLGAPDLLRRTDGAWVGKKALRDLYDLYPDALPPIIRDRRKVPMNEGAGFDTKAMGHWERFAEETLSEQAFQEISSRFKAFGVTTREEALYLNRLSLSMDVDRVPHLKSRPYIWTPAKPN